MSRSRVRTILATSVALGCLAAPAIAGAAQAPVGLGTAGTYGVLAGSTVTNTGPTRIGSDLGLAPGTAITGFPPGLVSGATHAADPAALQAKDDLTTAYDDAAGRSPALAVAGDLGGLTVTGGAYRAASSINLTGTLTLDAQGNPSQVFIFQIGSSLTTATSSRVLLVNGAQSCNVFWQVGSSATLGTASTFDGTLLALTSITAQHGATVDGRLLARNGAVTLDDNTVTSNGCASAPIPPGGGGTGGGGTTPTPGGTAPTGGGGGATGGGNGTSILTPTSTVVARHIGVYGTTRCLPRTFSVSVRGLFIRRVVFSVQGRNIATRTTAPFAAMVEPVAGIRTVRARVTYSDGTAPVTLTMRYRACAKAAVPTRPTAPRVPIRPPAFTG